MPTLAPANAPFRLPRASSFGSSFRSSLDSTFRPSLGWPSPSSLPDHGTGMKEARTPATAACTGTNPAFTHTSAALASTTQLLSAQATSPLTHANAALTPATAAFEVVNDLPRYLPLAPHRWRIASPMSLKTRQRTLEGGLGIPPDPEQKQLRHSRNRPLR